MHTWIFYRTALGLSFEESLKKLNPKTMNTFHSFIFIENTIAQYEISKTGEQFKATLLPHHAEFKLPMEIALWKESGQWRTSQYLSDHALYQFASSIDNHLLKNTIASLKELAAA
jgi:hypothetical protein